MKTETKSKLADLVIQITSVMIGVYLGFLASNFGDKQKLRSQLNIFESSIQTEIKINKNKIENIIDYHRMLRDSANYYLNIDKEVTEMPDFFKGMKLPSLIKSAYDTGIQTGIINELAINEIQKLNQIYSQQESYSEYSLIALFGIISIDFSDKNMGKMLRFLSFTMTDIVITEEALLEVYREID